MFHRVKSDVQETEQKNMQESESGYRVNDSEQQENPATIMSNPSRSYESNQQINQEEEPKMRAREESAVQSKYTRNSKEDHSSDAPSVSGGYQPSVARSGGYVAPSTSSYSTPHSPDIYAGSDRVLTIGRGINMSGEIDSCEQLLVEGTVEAALKGAKTLDIASSGVFYGTVEIEEATIAGRFEGDITVNGRLTIKSSGVITGSISYRELEVESGAVIDGRMTPLKGNVDPKVADRYRAGTEASAMAKPKEIAGKKPNREPANAGSGLFSKVQTSY